MDRIRTKTLYKTIIQAAEKSGQEAVDQARRELARADYFFLLVNVLGREDCDNDWVFDRCREVQENSDGILDLWARFHYKTTIKSLAAPIVKVLQNPEICICILSYNAKMARKFLYNIQQELENCKELIRLFPNILYENPDNQSPSWSLNNGLQVKRTSNRREKTIEAYGLVNEQPVGSHYDLLIYDDIITPEAVRTPEFVQKVNQRVEESYFLGHTTTERWYQGTRYHFNDSYQAMIDRGVPTRIYPAVNEDGTTNFLTREEVEAVRKDMGTYVFNCQFQLNPAEDSVQGFDISWMRYWKAEHFRNMNIYILVDPAGSKKKRSDYTSMFVVGLGADRNYYVITMIRDRLSLSERAYTLFRLHQEYDPVGVGYEKISMQSDVEYIYEMQDKRNYRFYIAELGKNTDKVDRIQKLEPLFREGRVFLPDTCIRTNYEKKSQDLTKIFVNEEIARFPYGAHDDMLDCFEQITNDNLNASFPMKEIEKMEKTGDLSYSTYDPATF